MRLLILGVAAALSFVPSATAQDADVLPKYFHDTRVSVCFIARPVRGLSYPSDFTHAGVRYTVSIYVNCTSSVRDIAVKLGEKK